MTIAPLAFAVVSANSTYFIFRELLFFTTREGMPACCTFSNTVCEG
jgi:hypothetical protein